MRLKRYLPASDLKEFFSRRLLAAVIKDLSGQTTTRGYEEELHRQRKRMDVILTPEIKLQRADVQQLLVSKEELPPEQQKWSPSLDQEDPESPYIKDEQEELWSSQEEEQLRGLEVAETTMFPFTAVSVKSEDDEEKPQSSQFYQRQTEQMETGADREDCGGAEPERDLDQERYLQPEIEVEIEGSSEPETDDSDDDWKETREHQSGLNSVENLKNHKKSYGCSECGKLFKIRSRLIQHLRIHTGEKPFSCSECGKKFHLKDSLTRHMVVHTEEKPFSCSICSQRFKHKCNITLHMAHHRGEKPYGCSVCDQRFSWPNQLKRHKCLGQAADLHQNQTEEKREAETERDSDQKRHLQPETHIETEDSLESETDDSDDWKETRKRQSGLNSVDTENIRSQTDKKSHSCSECGKTFKKKHDLTRHLRLHTGEKPFSCSVCDKRFNRKWHLTTHMLGHTGEKPFVCSECGNRFRQKKHLISHEKVHSGEKPFSCSYCGKRFNRKGSMNTHMIAHEGEKPFGCSLCSKRFYYKAHLNSHMLVHTGEKPFSCCLCSKRFTLNSYLTLHMAHHRGEKPFSCSVCEKSFLWRSQLRKHKCDEDLSSKQRCGLKSHDLDLSQT
ncbi:uncharacterized protein LKV04_008354 [Tautogolabrus adspersus]